MVYFPWKNKGEIIFCFSDKFNLSEGLFYKSFTEYAVKEKRITEKLKKHIFLGKIIGVVTSLSVWSLILGGWL